MESLCIGAGRLKLLAASVKPGYTAVVVFDDRTTLGVVRWRLATLVDRLSGLLGSQEHRSMGSPITDEVRIFSRRCITAIQDRGPIIGSGTRAECPLEAGRLR